MSFFIKTIFLTMLLFSSTVFGTSVFTFFSNSDTCHGPADGIIYITNDSKGKPVCHAVGKGTIWAVKVSGSCVNFNPDFKTISDFCSSFHD